MVDVSLHLCQTKSAFLHQILYILLYSEFCLKKSNHNQFDDLMLVTCWLILTICNNSIKSLNITAGGQESPLGRM